MDNRLAYLWEGVLNITNTVNGRPQGFKNVSLGVRDFAWFPNGKEFIASSQSNLLPTGWEPVRLFRIEDNANLNQHDIQPFFTLPINNDAFFAINASTFKWSTDGKWVSFLATPTASWSMDSNTLCTLSASAHDFREIGKMLHNAHWFEWAPTSNVLAYISGEGRFFVENKRTSIVELPAISRVTEYTPKGYVDLDLAWYDDNHVIVARAKENKEWKEGPIPTMFTKLYSIDIATGKQIEVTQPKKNELDIKPRIEGSYITWFRKLEKATRGDIWFKKGIQGEEMIWIRNADGAPEIFRPRQTTPK